MSSPTMITTVELDCHGCSLTIPVGTEVVLTDFGWVHPICSQDDA